MHECDDFFTYETETTRQQWQHLVAPNVSEPFSDNPHLDLTFPHTTLQREEPL